MLLCGQIVLVDHSIVARYRDAPVRTARLGASLQVANACQLIAKRQYQSVTQQQSPIREVHDVHQTLMTMSQQISAYQQEQKKMLNGIVELIAKAIDSK